MNKNDLPAGASRYVSGDRELRTIRTQPIETRSEDGDLTVEGYGAVFGEWATIGGFFQERIADGAFTKAVKENDVRLLLNHNPDNILARTKNGTLHLEEDKKGLLYRGDLNPADPAAVSAHAKIDRGDIDQSSFAFRVVEEKWEDANPDKAGDLPKRTIIQAELFDVAPVTYPAYESTTVGTRMDGALLALSSVLGLSDASRSAFIAAMTDERREALEEEITDEIDESRCDDCGCHVDTDEENDPAAEEAPVTEEEDERDADESDSESEADDAEGAQEAEEAPVKTDDEREAALYALKMRELQWRLRNS